MRFFFFIPAYVYSRGGNLCFSTFVFQQLQGNPFYSSQLRTSTHIVHHRWRNKSCKNENTGHKRLRVGDGQLCEAGCGGLSREVETSRQYIENHYGDSNQGAQGSEAGSERKAWEAADWGISSHSEWFNWQLPPGLCRTSRPQRPRLYGTGMRLAVLF